jgi:hypothetical protein
MLCTVLQHATSADLVSQSAVFIGQRVHVVAQIVQLLSVHMIVESHAFVTHGALLMR